MAARGASAAVGDAGDRVPAEGAEYLVSAFRQGLSQAGFVEGQNVTIEYRWTEGQYDRLPVLAAELVRSKVAVLAATGGDPAILAARAATATIPILFTTGSDPVALGYVASLNRPSGNVTGVMILTSSLGAKRIGLVGSHRRRSGLFLLRTLKRRPSSPAVFTGREFTARTGGSLNVGQHPR